MIFVTVGTQLPFERLIKAVDDWAKENPSEKVVAQIGETKYSPKHMEVVGKLDPVSYRNYFEQAKVVVSHVGMGTIISGLELSKPLVLMPRLASLGEHRNDHQLGTAEKFQDMPNIHIVEKAEKLASTIDNALQVQNDLAQSTLTLSPSLTAKLSEFLQSVKAGTV